MSEYEDCIGGLYPDECKECPYGIHSSMCGTEGCPDDSDY